MVLAFNVAPRPCSDLDGDDKLVGDGLVDIVTRFHGAIPSFERHRAQFPLPHSRFEARGQAWPDMLGNGGQRLILCPLDVQAA